MSYYLADSIYLEWPTFVKPISNPRDQKTAHFGIKQLAYRKDIERSFGVFQARWPWFKDRLLVGTEMR